MTIDLKLKLHFGRLWSKVDASTISGVYYFKEVNRNWWLCSLYLRSLCTSLWAWHSWFLVWSK